MEVVRTWKVRSDEGRVLLTLNGREYLVSFPESLAFDLNHVAKETVSSATSGLSATARRIDSERVVLLDGPHAGSSWGVYNARRDMAPGASRFRVSYVPDDQFVRIEEVLS